MTINTLLSRTLGRARTLRRPALTAGLTIGLLSAGLTGVVTTTPVASASQVQTVAAATDTVIGTYTNSTSTITVRKNVRGSGSDTVVAYIADVTVTDATTVKSAFARNTFGSRITEATSVMARNNNAVLAINTDYYGFRNDGIIIRNGKSYRDVGTRQGLGILRNGGFLLYDEKQYTADKLLTANVWQGLSFGPALLNNGRVPSGIDTYEIGDFGPVQPGAPGSIQGRQPRTGIGLLGSNHYIMIVVDGRNAGGSRGVTMPEFATMFQEAGATHAFNLDGGGSSTMYFNGRVVNSPAFGSERATSDILYLAR